MFKLNLVHVWIGILVLSGMFLIGQDSWFPTGPSITQIDQYSASEGDLVTINGRGFGASQGTSIVTFNAVDAGSAVSWSDTSISLAVPTGATSGPVIVTVDGTPSNPYQFYVNFASLQSNTVAVDDSVQVSEVSEDQIVYVDDGSLPPLTSGDVILGDDGQTGYLRKVTDIQTGGGLVVVTTEPATIVDAFEEAEVNLENATSSEDKEQYLHRLEIYEHRKELAQAILDALELELDNIHRGKPSVLELEDDAFASRKIVTSSVCAWAHEMGFNIGGWEAPRFWRKQSERRYYTEYLEIFDDVIETFCEENGEYYTPDRPPKKDALFLWAEKKYGPVSKKVIDAMGTIIRPGLTQTTEKK